MKLWNQQWQRRQTLILGARDFGDHEALEEFHDYYEGFIRMALMQLQAPMDDPEDILVLPS
jgi:hypothetical protein